jgi:hypothetical protein
MRGPLRLRLQQNVAAASASLPLANQQLFPIRPLRGPVVTSAVLDTIKRKRKRRLMRQGKVGLHGRAVRGRAALPGHRGKSEVRAISAPTSDFCFMFSDRRYKKHDGPIFESFLLLTSLYWITSSALASNDGGIVRPRALAVLRLMTSSNLVGSSMGRSPGRAPLSVLST